MNCYSKDFRMDRKAYSRKASFFDERQSRKIMIINIKRIAWRPAVHRAQQLVSSSFKPWTLLWRDNDRWGRRDDSVSDKQLRNIWKYLFVKELLAWEWQQCFFRVSTWQCLCLALLKHEYFNHRLRSNDFSFSSTRMTGQVSWHRRDKQKQAD